MPELNLNQITDKLNAEFAGAVRKLVFWYDANAEFAKDIDALPLANAKVLHLAPDNQFYTKYFLECVDKDTNYLVYAPFAKPATRDNHLADTLKYSKEFFADRASLLSLDLGIDERFKPIIQHYIKFFAAKDRTQKFYDLELESFNRSTIEIALMSVLCKNKTASMEEVVRAMLTDNGLEDNKYLSELERYDLISAFWQQIEALFGYTDVQPTLEKLVYTLFVTYAAKTINADMPQAWKGFVSYKSGNIIAFLDSLMNSVLYRERFDEISKLVFDGLDGASQLSKLPIEVLTACNVFAGVDAMLIRWMSERLESEDIDARLDGKTIPEICAARRKLHFGQVFKSRYFVIENAYHILAMGQYSPVSGINNLIKKYTETDYAIDRRYRYFYLHLDRIEDNTGFEKLRELIENFYTNEYLNKAAVNWNTDFVLAQGRTAAAQQADFYTKYIRSAKNQVVVIISDALRYEVGRTLFEKLQADEKCSATIGVMQSVLPSYTRFGMGVLLPHKTLEMSDTGKILVDGKPCDDLKQREAILQSYQPNSRGVQYDDIKSLGSAALREIFTGKDVVYVYHNQIDARGDKLNTENEVFLACEEAVDEIHSLIMLLTKRANRSSFIVTADHGFIYKRDKLTESDKISGNGAAHALIGRRYAIGEDAIQTDGIAGIPLKNVLKNDDNRTVSFPIGTDIFKVAGSGQNYVHGGSSPQEMLIPVIEVKTEKGSVEVSTVKIALVSLTSKITNLITTLDFVQTEAVSDVVKETQYKVFFISDDNERISNENIYVADRKDAETAKRVFRLRFTFKNKQYDKSRKYYLVAYDDKKGMEILRHEIIMDIAFADDFGFNL